MASTILAAVVNPRSPVATARQLRRGYSCGVAHPTPTDRRPARIDGHIYLGYKGTIVFRQEWANVVRKIRGDDDVFLQIGRHDDREIKISAYLTRHNTFTVICRQLSTGATAATLMSGELIVSAGVAPSGRLGNSNGNMSSHHRHQGPGFHIPEGSGARS